MFAVALALNLEERLSSKTAALAVVGRRDLAVPLGLAFAERTYGVRIVDLDVKGAVPTGGGRTYVRDTRPRRSRRTLRRGLEIVTEASVIADSNIAIICAPVPATTERQPDTSSVAEAARHVAAHLRPGHLVVLHSTGYPGTTEEVVRPILESTGLRVGQEIFLAFAAYRYGRTDARVTTDKVPVVVGGCDRISTRLAVHLMQQVSPRVIAVSSPAAAEMARLLENVFHTVNTGLINQVAQLCNRMGLDVWEVVEATAPGLRPSTALRPALVRGHGAGAEPSHLAWAASEHGFHMDFIDLADRVNREMPRYIVDRLLAALGTRYDGCRVLVLGVASVSDGDDPSHAAALEVMELLRRRNVNVIYHDPTVPEMRLTDSGDILRSQPLTRDVVEGADCVLILTDDASFDYEALVRDARLVFDTRNATRGAAAWREKVIRL